MQLDYLQHRPAIAVPFDSAATAAAIGRTTAGPRLALAAYATLRGDGDAVRVGADVFFGAAATAHIAHGRHAAVVGNGVTVGRFALVHACTLEDGVVVADAATVMDACVVGPRALIAPGAVVPPRKSLPGGFVYAGHPAQPVRAIDASELAGIASAVRRGAPAPGFAAPDLPPEDHRTLVAAADGPAPRIGRAYVAPTAALGGNVVVADDATVWFGCVLAARDARIVVGARSNVQDNSILVTDAAAGDLVIGERVTIGHNVRMSSGAIGDDALVGMSSIVGPGVVVERGGCIAAGAWVEPGTVVRAGWIWAGRPARPFRELKAAERDGFAQGIDIYVEYGAAYRDAR